MSIPSVSNEIYSPQTYGVQTTAPAAAASKPAEEEKTAASSSAAKEDTYVSSGPRKMDTETVNRMKAELEANKLRFINTVQNSLGNQLSINFGQGAWTNISEEDMKILQAEAIELTGENGYWGVEQTSQRIFSFAQALVGSDPSRVGEMRDAFIKGYQAVEKMWGGELPELSKNTYDSVMKLFDQWENPVDETEGAEAGNNGGAAGSVTEPAGAEPTDEKPIGTEAVAEASANAAAAAEAAPASGVDAGRNQTILSAMGVGAAT